MRKQIKPKQIMLSKRANVFYLEHVRVMQKDDRIVYLTQGGDTIERYFNIPDRNTAFVLLGKGSSITDAAARKFAESNIVVGFCGSGGSPLFSAVDSAFLVPVCEYRPTEYMQAWIKLWVDESARLQAAKDLLHQRIAWTDKWWSRNPALTSKGVSVANLDPASFVAQINNATSTQDLLLAEARWAKKIFAILAKATGFASFTREEGKGEAETSADKVNGFIDHGNYIAYGYAAVALNGLGISFSLPLLHGKTRRGALVFDIADLIKDAIVLPWAFVAVQERLNQKEFRAELIDICQREEVLDHVFTFVSTLPEKRL